MHNQDKATQSSTTITTIGQTATIMVIEIGTTSNASTVVKATPHQDKCHAFGKKCFNCGKFNHLAKYCKSNTTAYRQNNKQFVNAITSESTTNQDQTTTATANTNDSEAISQPHNQTFNFITERGKTTDSYIYTLEEKVEEKGDRPYVNIEVCNTIIEFLIDSGSQANAIDMVDFQRINPTPSLNPPNSLAWGYDSATPVHIAGYFTTTVRRGDKQADVRFVVTNGKAGCLLSYTTCEALGLIQIVDTVEMLDINSLEAKYPSLFSNTIGKLKNFQVKLHIDEGVQPKQQQHRRIPFHLRRKVEDKINKMIENDIIESVQLRGCHLSSLYPSHMTQRK